MTIINMPISHLLAANEFASKEQYRYYLNGVYIHVRDEKLHTVATDGHRLIDIPSEAPKDVFDGFIVPSDAIKKLKPVKFVTNVNITINGQILTIEYAGMTINCEAIDGTFPDYMRVIPTRDAVAIASIGFNPKYLGAFEKVNKILDAGVGIELEFTGENSPVRIINPLYLGVLMPMRVQ